MNWTNISPKGEDINKSDTSSESVFEKSLFESAHNGIFMKVREFMKHAHLNQFALYL